MSAMQNCSTLISS